MSWEMAALIWVVSFVVGLFVGGVFIHVLTQQAFRKYLQGKQRKIVDLERRRHEKAGRAGREI